MSYGRSVRYSFPCPVRGSYSSPLSRSRHKHPPLIVSRPTPAPRRHPHTSPNSLSQRLAMQRLATQRLRRVGTASGLEAYHDFPSRRNMMTVAGYWSTHRMRSVQDREWMASGRVIESMSMVIIRQKGGVGDANESRAEHGRWLRLKKTRG